MRVYAASVLDNFAGGTEQRCPCCGQRGRFTAFGHPPRYGARCAGCESLERHRLLVLMDQRHALIHPGDRLLHFAPEPVLERYLRGRTASYVSADIAQGRADRVENIETLSMPARSFDVVVCSHVLEHVDDERALSELSRVLAPGGRVLCMVPMIEGWDQTYENQAVSTGRERAQHFGQGDHVRYYGRDVRERIRAAGFELTEHTALGADSVEFGLLRGEKVFVATKG